MRVRDSRVLITVSHCCTPIAHRDIYMCDILAAKMVGIKMKHVFPPGSSKRKAGKERKANENELLAKIPKLSTLFALPNPAIVDSRSRVHGLAAFVQLFWWTCLILRARLINILCPFIFFLEESEAPASLRPDFFPLVPFVKFGTALHYISNYEHENFSWTLDSQPLSKDVREKQLPHTKYGSSERTNLSDQCLVYLGYFEF